MCTINVSTCGGGTQINHSDPNPALWVAVPAALGRAGQQLESARHSLGFNFHRGLIRALHYHRAKSRDGGFSSFSVASGR